MPGFKNRLETRSMSKRMSRKELLKTDEIAEAAFDVGHWLE